MAVDFSKLNASVSKLGTDVNALIAQASAGDATLQQSVDATQAAVEAIDAQVVAQLPKNS